MNRYSYIGFIKIINEWLWKLKQTKLKYKNYQVMLEIHIEQIKDMINLETDYESLELLLQYKADRLQELETLKAEINHKQTRIKYYQILENKYNIFG